MAMINCPECGQEIDEGVSVCPACGFPIKKKIAPAVEPKDTVKVMNPQELKKKKYMGIAMCIVGCVFLIFALTRITNDKYKFYVEHYEECMDGYDENANTANQYSGGLFKSGYNQIASSYIDMADDDMKEIWKYRGTAIVCCILGIGLGFVGYKNIKKGGEA